jgi:hypothetical protein
MDFLVERPPKEVLGQAEAYMLPRRFHVHLSKRTETTVLFTRIRTRRKGFLRTLLSAFADATIPRQKVRLLASEAGEGRTRLTIIEVKHRGEARRMDRH